MKGGTTLTSGTVYPLRVVAPAANTSGSSLLDEMVSTLRCDQDDAQGVLRLIINLGHVANNTEGRLSQPQIVIGGPQIEEDAAFHAFNDGEHNILCQLFPVGDRSPYPALVQQIKEQLLPNLGPQQRIMYRQHRGEQFDCFILALETIATA